MRSRFTAVALALGMLMCGTLVWSASRAAFTATTSNDNNSWSTGSVALTDDDANGVMFSPTGLTPSSPSVSHCIKVTYNGDITADVHLYADTYSHTKSDNSADGLAANASLGTYVNLTVEQDTAGGPTGAYGGCGNFSPAAALYTGTVYDFSTKTFADNIGTWSPTAATQTKVFRFTYSLADNNLAQGLKCTVRFVFEAHST